ncbi:hypothetical protein GCM10027589_05800 [Actinocorallia lasiicapitis]
MVSPAESVGDLLLDPLAAPAGRENDRGQAHQAEPDPQNMPDPVFHDILRSVPWSLPRPTPFPLTGSGHHEIVGALP